MNSETKKNQTGHAKHRHPLPYGQPPASGGKLGRIRERPIAVPLPAPAAGALGGREFQSLKFRYDKKTVYIICGPTAAGKTEYGVTLAKQLNGEIISADSRQVYEGLTIGSGAPPLKHKKYRGIVHHLVCVRSPLVTYSVYDFQKDARQLIQTIFAKKKTPIIVGGTGFWIEALVRGLDFRSVKPNLRVRKRLEKKLLENGIDTLARELMNINRALALETDLANPRRVIRALEISLAKEIPRSSPPPHERTPIFTLIGITMPRGELKKRIARRVDAMMEKGLARETLALLRKYFFKQNLSKSELLKRLAKISVQRDVQKFLNEYPAFSGIGYREIIDAFMGRISIEQAIELIKQRTLQYVKRQMTWFKKQKDIEWITPPRTFR